MFLCFELSMPNVGSWNGKWTGEKKYYAKIINFGQSKQGIKKATEILSKGYFHYSFGDGWSAGISVKEVNAKEAARIRRKSNGFWSYDWMVESIKHNLQIKAPTSSGLAQ